MDRIDRIKAGRIRRLLCVSAQCIGPRELIAGYSILRPGNRKYK
jgi:hypothetical protein